jgi:hypothetical protein
MNGRCGPDLHGGSSFEINSVIGVEVTRGV